MNLDERLGQSSCVLDLLKTGTPISDLQFERLPIRRVADPQGGSTRPDSPNSRDEQWCAMLRRALGSVPEGAEKAPPCPCKIVSTHGDCNFGGLAGLPPAVRLMDGFFPVRDQCKRGTCSAFALAALCEYMLQKKVQLSEQSLYYFTKLVTPGRVEDLKEGVDLLDAIHAVEEVGVCPLSEWHYNPESWNFVEDTSHEGQGKALIRKLEAAQQYRFHNWRMFSKGSVLYFKQMLSAGFPIYTGVVVTSDWESDETRRTGVIPFSHMFWKLSVSSPSQEEIEAYMLECGIDPETEATDELEDRIARKLIQQTLEYVSSAVFGCPLIVSWQVVHEDELELEVFLGRIEGGHALCLAGYVDDETYLGGGYFIARNSWSDKRWAPESPEMPGYALLPYAYVAELGSEGFTMSEFPQQGRQSKMTDENEGISSADHGSAHVPVSSTPPPLSNKDLDGCPGVRAFVLTQSMRDQTGILLKPGTPVLACDPECPSKILRDTPQNRALLQEAFKQKAKQKAEEARRKAEEERQKAEAERKLRLKELEARFDEVVLETVSALLAADQYAIVYISDVRKALLANEPLFTEFANLDQRIRTLAVAQQKSRSPKFWFGPGFGGQEEIRQIGRDADRILK